MEANHIEELSAFSILNGIPDRNTDTDRLYPEPDPDIQPYVLLSSVNDSDHREALYTSKDGDGIPILNVRFNIGREFTVQAGFTAWASFHFQ